MSNAPVVKRWTLLPDGDSELVDSLTQQLGIERKLANMLVQRGVKTFEEARSFFRPSLSELHDPYLMKDMNKAVDRILLALESDETIMIYGDYDVDGTTSVALLYSFFRELCPERLHFYIPDRYAEGYGVSFRGIDVAEELGCTLIIALDCGIRSVDKVDYAANKGIDFIICDHHLPGSEVPKASAVLDPKQSDCAYPYKELCGCGIGFKLIQALKQVLPHAGDTDHWLDLVATAIAADIVPITGENRILAYFGMLQINTKPRPGIRMLLRSGKDGANSNPTKEFSISDLVFTAAPRINAAGRIDHGKKAVELLITENESTAEEILSHINTQNVKRKDLDQLMTSEALAILDSNELYRDVKSTVLFKNDWHKGVVGIVASRVMEKYYRPTIILTESNGKATGSARSVKGFDVHEAISACADLLEQFGGHKYAAGMTLPLENVEAFRQRFEEIVAETIQEESLVPVVDIDMELELSDITPKFYRIMKQFAPFGPGNMSPVFLTKHLQDDGYGKIVGTHHLKLKLGKSGQPSFDAIAFGMAHMHPAISKGIPVDVCYTLEENHWNGKVNLQWMVKDMRC
ncbi:MAG TPA: single-stranded-DNA-specific exonuclease RecJ [Flavobacteriales bacterium]|nr:single-stranded-DNA-specific exonuclease RecJ [Flavobacteriales bacterium]HPH82862.1 single-stranded-DNA-specific exonuclease RecJ [Flavobacteriales bacterium]